MSSFLNKSLRKGQACTCCRRRKTKCDGGRPICIQCSSNGRELDCEYSDGVTPTRTEMLQGYLAQLQNRVNELEGSYSQRPQAAGASAQHVVCDVLNQIRYKANKNYLKHSFSSVQIPSQWWTNEIPPTHISRALVNIFIQHSHQLCTSLSLRSLETYITTRPDDANYPHPALMNSIFLWGARLSRSNSLSTPDSEQTLYSKALNLLQTRNMSSLTVRHSLQAVQAEILTATYLFTCGGRSLETDFRINSAVRLALGLGMNHVIPGVSNDSVRDGENITTFWELFLLDQMWSLTSGKPAIIRTYGTSRLSITTPWPLTTQGVLKKNETYSPSNNVDPLLQFEMEGGTSSSGLSHLALAAKAIYLCQRAVQVSSLPTSSEETRTLDAMIFNFISTLPPVDSRGNITNKSYQISVHAIAYYSFIKLHESHAQVDIGAYKRCVQAACYISMLLGSFTPEETFEPYSITLPCFVVSSKIIMREISRIRQMEDPSQNDLSPQALTMVLSRLLDALTDLSEVFTVLEPQLNTIREMRETLLS